MKSKLGLALWSAASLSLVFTSSGATYKEAAGRVVIEAEHFDSRTTHATDNHRWQIIPDENGTPETPVDAGFSNARGNKYIQSLPDVAGGGQNNNAAATQDNDPKAHYKVLITHPGRYRLWLRWGGYDGSSDSMYASIVELKTPAGPGPNWYRYVRNNAGDFDSGWDGSGAPSTDAANALGGGGGEVPAIFDITTAGTYTIRLTMREDGSAVDALALQLQDLPAPGNPGPAESFTTTATDNVAPTIETARTAGNPTGLLIGFSESLSAATAERAANYTINNGVTVTGARLVNDYTVLLTTSPIAPGQTYEVTVNGVQDVAPTPNTIAANTRVPFFQVGGVIQRRVFNEITGGAVTDLTNHAKFTEDRPDLVDYLTSLEAPINFGDNYGQQVRGYVTAPVTGNYIFYIAADDNAELFLSTDEDPVNKKLIARQPGWSNSRQYLTVGNVADDPAEKRSDQFPNSEWNPPNQITLTAGKRYYIEVLHKEGGGGDDLSVAWQLPGAPDIADGAAPIPGTALSPFGITPGNVTITTQPAAATLNESSTATFSVVGGGSPPFSYQWLLNGTPIAGATGRTFTTPRLLRANAANKYSVRVSNAFSSVTSSEVGVTITPDVTAPAPSSVKSVSGDGKTVLVAFSELLDQASAQTAANYVFTPGNITATGASLDATGTNVTLTLPSALTSGTENTLTLGGLKDFAGNAMGTGASIKFTFNPITYQANILLDGPIAFYRFEEPANATTATNLGTSAASAGHGLYLNDVGGPGPAKAEAGPRPPTFVGFDAANRAATFDGQGDWVDTQVAYLDGLGAFSLEYWVKPSDRANQGNRIGIVGQNDAIEYGFIDPNTIQIWTPNGGSLNTPYSFPDNEWHHVATIADGASIKTYYDGALVGTVNATTASYGTSAFTVHIGGGGVFDGSGNYFLGQIDEVAIFDKAIPADRIAAHFNAGKNGGVAVTTGAINSGSAGIRASITRSGNNVVISWTPAGGRLQSASALGGGASSWTDVGTQNPATVPIGTGARFFRVAQ